MPAVAIAGGTGGLGRALAEAINATGEAQVIVLSRKTGSDKHLPAGIKLLPVDYDNIDGTAAQLELHHVDTLICALSPLTPPEVEFDLISAAAISRTTLRHIAGHPAAKHKIEARRRLQATDLEWTAWYTGFFAEYLVAPNVETCMEALPCYLDHEKATAVIPGSGNVPTTFSYAFDITRFVAASLRLETWQNDTYLIGDKVTLNDLVKIAEEVRGVPYRVTYDSVELLRQGKTSDLPCYNIPDYPRSFLEPYFAFHGLLFENGEADFDPSLAINKQFPTMETRSIRDLMTAGWKALAVSQ